MTAVDQLISQYLDESRDKGCTPQNVFVVGRPPGFVVFDCFSLVCRLY